VVRWSHDGTILASAGDEAVIFLWKENDIKNQKTLDNDEDENKENWFSFKCFR
jgi:chromatin assembly factor 1 subunit B